MGTTPTDFVSLAEMKAVAVETKTVDIERLGKVEFRELTAEELAFSYQSAFVTSSSGDVVFNPSLHDWVKVALSMENPSLGATMEDRVMAVETVSALPARVFQAMLAEVQTFSSVDMSRVEKLSKIIESVPVLYRVLEVLDKKGKLLKDLNGVTKRELELWMAFYRNQERVTEEQLEELEAKINQES